MAPRGTPRTDIEKGIEADVPEIEQQDWDALGGADILPDSLPDSEGISHGIEKDGDLPEEDDDNPYQDSDDALPDDEEEAAITRHPTREGLFDEI